MMLKRSSRLNARHFQRSFWSRTMVGPIRRYTKVELLSSTLDIHSSPPIFIFVQTVKIGSESGEITIPVPGGIHSAASDFGHQCIETNYQNHLLCEILQSYAVGDICLIGPRGSGKSMAIAEIAHLLNQSIEPMVLYHDMTARDFVQQRTTTPNGDTIWRDSALIRAAKCGSIAVLDGIHRIHHSTMSVLDR